MNGFKYADLVPHWEIMEKRLSVAQIPLSETNRNNRTLYDGCQKLGYQVDTIRRNVKNCFKSGYCGMGCPIDAKQSMLVTCIPDAVKSGATILSHCRVQRFEKNGSGFRLHATVIGKDDATATGSAITIRGGSPRPRVRRLHRNSPGILPPLRHSTGDGRVGRRTYLHPVVGQFGIYPEPINGFYGAPQSVASHQFAHRGDDVGYFLEAAPVDPMLGALAISGIGATHAQAMSKLSHAAGHIALTIDGFHPDETCGTVKLLRKSGASPRLPDPGSDLPSHAGCEQDAGPYSTGLRRDRVRDRPRSCVRHPQGVGHLSHRRHAVWSEQTDDLLCARHGRLHDER